MITAKIQLKRQNIKVQEKERNIIKVVRMIERRNAEVQEK